MSSTDILNTLKIRFDQNMQRHKNIQWKDVESKLFQKPSKLESLIKMEQTGGEPDVIDFNEKTTEFIFCDCSSQSPSGRRSICYDKKAQDSRDAKSRPRGNVVDMAQELGVELMSEGQYRKLQQLGEFDTKTSSWLITPQEIRDLGGAIFADRRYNNVFVYHNGAESYYAARGFRGILRV